MSVITIALVKVWLTSDVHVRLTQFLILGFNGENLSDWVFALGIFGSGKFKARVETVSLPSLRSNLKKRFAMIDVPNPDTGGSPAQI